jgi:uncharacterized delta-60 repeat protein
MLKPLKMVFGMVLLLLFVVPVFAESVDTAWVRRYDGPANGTDYPVAMAVDDSGNVYVTGCDEGSGTGTDLATIKYLPNGDTAWVRRYYRESNLYDGPEDIAVDDSGNVYITGQTQNSTTGYDCATLKYHPDGDTAWLRIYNGFGDYTDRGEAIAVDDSGNVYVTGASRNCWPSPEWNYLTIRYDPDGGTDWQLRYQGLGNGLDGAAAIAVDSSGNVYVTGTSFGFGTGGDYGTIRYSPNGDSWIKTYNGPGNGTDEGLAIAVDGSGCVYVMGQSQGDGTYLDYATIKYLSNGDTAWVRRYNGPANSDDEVRDMAIDNSGNVYVTGGSYNETDEDWLTIKYLPNGDTGWVRRYNGPGNGNDRAEALAVDGSGNVYVTGRSLVSGANYDYTTIKYLPDGDSAWVIRYDGPVSGSDGAVAIAVDDSGNVYVTGRSNGSGGWDDFCTIKYVQGVTGIWDEPGSEERPSEFDLSQNYPNPFNPTTNIEFTLSKSGLVILQIYDVLGREVRTLVSEELSSGYKSVIWDGKNEDGKDVASGVYFYQLKVDDFSEPKKMLLLK